MDWTQERLQQKGYQWKQGMEDKIYAKEGCLQKVSLEIREGIPLFSFECFQECQDWMGMAFSTRLGGYSQDYLSEMNLGWNRGDSVKTVRKNYRKICQGLQVDATKLVFSDQVHETVVEYATEKHCAGAELEKKFSGVDGLYTDIPGLVLATSYADCVPLFFADPIHRIIASSHSGWKGTVGQIGKCTVEAMVRRFNTNPEDIIALIGPSICQDCYEVSEDVVKQFQDIYTEAELMEIAEAGKGQGKYQLDLQAACYFTLKKAGVRKEHIQVSRICTCCHSDLLFSHRATQGKRGNLNGFIWKHAAQVTPVSDW